MSRLATRRAFAPALLAGLVLTAVAATPIARPATVPGITFTLTMGMSMPPGMGAGSDMFVKGKGTSAGDQTVMEIENADGTQGIYAAGDRLITTAAGEILVVRASTKTITDVSAMISNPFASMPPELAQQLTFSNVAVNFEKLGAGEAIEGRATEKFKVTMSYTMNIMGQSIPSTVVTELWTAKLPVKIANPFSPGGAALKGLNGPMADMMGQMAAAMAKVEGVPLKTVAVTSLSAGGQQISITQTTTMTDIKEIDVDMSAFAVPADYKKGL